MERSLSYKATMSALLINLYRDEPILHLPYQFLRSLIELDHKINFHGVFVMFRWLKKWTKDWNWREFRTRISKRNGR